MPVIPMEDADIKPKQKDSNMLAAISYVLHLIVAVLVYLIAKEDRYARYHALQAILLSIAISAVALICVVLYIPVFIFTLGFANLVLIPLIFLLVFCMLAFNIYLAYMAYNGRAFMLPFIGKIAAEHV